VSQVPLRGSLPRTAQQHEGQQSGRGDDPRLHMKGDVKAMAARRGAAIPMAPPICCALVISPDAKPWGGRLAY
jgi:hypothetical protein